MKKSISCVFLFLCVSFISLLFIGVAPKEERPCDSINIPQEYLDAVKEHPDDRVVRIVPKYSYAGANKDTVIDWTDLTTKDGISTVFYDDQTPTFYVRSQKDGSVRRVCIDTENNTVKENPEPSYMQSDVLLCFELLDHPENFFSENITFQTVFFFGDRENAEGSLAYIETEKGAFVIWSPRGNEFSEHGNEWVAPGSFIDPFLVIPFEEFHQLVEDYCETLPLLPTAMGGYTFERVLLKKYDLTKYHAPFDIDRYNQELAFKNTVKTALPIAGAVAVGVVIVVLVVVIAVSKKDGTDESSQTPAESADPTQG